MKINVASLALAVTVAGLADAATLGPLPCLGVPPVGLNPTELAGNILCPQFGAAGDLTSILLAFSGRMEGVVTVSNNTPSTQSGSAASHVRFVFGPSPGFGIPNPLFTVVGDTGPIIQPLPTTDAFPVAGAGSGSVVNTTQFAPYIGAGTFSIPVTTNSLILLNFAGKVTASHVTMASAHATVTYNYQAAASAVPEPASMLLVGTGLLVGAMQRRRAQSRAG